MTEILAFRKIGANEFDRDSSAKAGVASAEHLTHSAISYDGFNPVRSKLRSGAQRAPFF
jgi:hypothetical protein